MFMSFVLGDGDGHYMLCLLFFWFYFKKNRLVFLRELLHFIVAVDLPMSLLTTEESSGEENT